VAPSASELETGDPRTVVLENALRKARSVSGQRVLGVDTAVVLDGQVYGKPADRSEAASFLERLNGSNHEVMSGVALLDAGEERTDVTVTRVRFRDLTPRELEWYLDTEEWRERAGGYAIQGKGAALVASIDGDYTNVVGLPVPTLLGLFAGIS
jgi:septum formation protein